MIREDLPPNIQASAPEVTDADHQLRIVLDGINRPDDLEAVYAHHHITESDFHEWRATALSGATLALADRATAKGSPHPGS